MQFVQGSTRGLLLIYSSEKSKQLALTSDSHTLVVSLSRYFVHVDLILFDDKPVMETSLMAPIPLLLEELKQPLGAPSGNDVYAEIHNCHFTSKWQFLSRTGGLCF